ncbi:unnamed protein product, partial [Nippostrongylus brasiliensis]|uniref:Transmembrane protein n=1 Tax=Nippostrongylus brasiliensis TaxID=27835 RepID=A0A0N4XMS5_NIPBR
MQIFQQSWEWEPNRPLLIEAVMNRVINWIKSRADHNVVSYSRFGLPGDELDDRPPPTVIHVAPFREDSAEFMAFGTHAQRAAVISAGVGLSLVIFIFLAVFFEFDWYHHEKGVDMGALG